MSVVQSILVKSLPLIEICFMGLFNYKTHSVELIITRNYDLTVMLQSQFQLPLVLLLYFFSLAASLLGLYFYHAFFYDLVMGHNIETSDVNGIIVTFFMLRQTRSSSQIGAIEGISVIAGHLFTFYSQLRLNERLRC